MDEFREHILQRVPIIYPWCLHTDGSKINHTLFFWGRLDSATIFE